MLLQKNLPRKVRGSGNAFLEKPTPKAFGFTKCFFRKNLLSTLPLLTFPAYVPNFSLQKRICCLLSRHFPYITLLQLHFRVTKKHGNTAACLGGRGLRLRPYWRANASVASNTIDIMSDENLSGLQLPRREPKIILERAEYIFPALRNSLVSVFVFV
jgi:hypothetical protein